MRFCIAKIRDFRDAAGKRDIEKNVLILQAMEIEKERTGGWNKYGTDLECAV